MEDRGLRVDHPAVLRGIAALASSTDERAVARGVVELIGTMCQAHSVVYNSEPFDLIGEVVSTGAGPSEHLLALVAEAGDAPACAEDSFAVRIVREGLTIAKVGAEGFQSAAHRDRCLAVAQAASAVIALVIWSSRTRAELLSAHEVARHHASRTQARLEMSEALNRIDEMLARSLYVDDIMAAVVEDAAAAVGADLSYLVRRVPGGWLLEHGFGFASIQPPFKFNDAEMPCATEAAETREPSFTGDVTTMPGVAPSTHPDFAGVRSILAVPLIVNDEVVGALSFRAFAVDAFDELHVDFARRFGSALSYAIVNTRLYYAQRDIADTLQEALLVMPDAVRGVAFGHNYKSATVDGGHVGGDFYDLFEIASGIVGLTIGDISGKGLEAAKMTSFVKDSVRAYAHLDATPHVVIERTSELFVKTTPPELFATVFFGVLNSMTGKLTYCSAGHPHALLKRSDGTLRRLDRGSPLLGAFSDVEFVKGSTRVLPGDVLVMFTDGLTDARGDDGVLGAETVAKVVEAAQTKDPYVLAYELLDRIEELSSGRLPDDVAVLCVAIDPHAVLEARQEDTDAREAEDAARLDD